ncbi:hypothetical protein Glove_13g292 [Diversispora epigaea]|uniref:Uncharacterized protein n=1 Tax=Diversispora epigaea TaxID=1348612 RepID=A0A397JYY4_9GLOM|nr:hypothetical protein Glove_13g292 [Diversispora epigaea]
MPITEILTKKLWIQYNDFLIYRIIPQTPTHSRKYQHPYFIQKNTPSIDQSDCELVEKLNISTKPEENIVAESRKHSISTSSINILAPEERKDFEESNDKNNNGRITYTFISSLPSPTVKINDTLKQYCTFYMNPPVTWSNIGNNLVKEFQHRAILCGNS